MQNAVLVKDGVSFRVIAPAGFRLLGAIERVSRQLSLDLMITCACEGHLPDDPHSHGEAYDVRTHALTTVQKQNVLAAVMADLSEGGIDSPMPVSIGLGTTRFYGQIEHPGEPGEHIHLQRRKGTVYP